MGACNEDELYQRQLTVLKSIVPQLTRPKDVSLCAEWIERFAVGDEEDHGERNRHMDTLIGQLQWDDRCRDADRSDSGIGRRSTTSSRIDDGLSMHYSRLYENCQRKCAYFEHEVFVAKQHSQEQEMKHDTLLAAVQMLLRHLEVGLSEAMIGQNALAEIGDLFTAEMWSPQMPDCFQSQIQRIERKWSEVIARIRTQTTVISQPPPTDKYKNFARKSVRKIQRLQDELDGLRRDQQIRASTESIRDAAWRTEWIRDLGARQQAQMVELFETLDGRCATMLKSKSTETV